MFQGVEFVEPGRVHLIAWVWAESVFEKAIDRRWLNVNALDEYRPDLVEQKEDVIYECEYGAMKTVMNIHKNITKKSGASRDVSMNTLNYRIRSQATL